MVKKLRLNEIDKSIKIWNSGLGEKPWMTASAQK